MTDRQASHAMLAAPYGSIGCALIFSEKLYGLAALLLLMGIAIVLIGDHTK